MTMESITPNQEKQIVRFMEDAASKAAREATEEVLASLPLDKDAVQTEVIEKGDELQAEIMPAVKGALTKFLVARIDSYELTKVSILIKANGKGKPYFDEALEYWFNLWRRQLGIKNPDFSGIVPFVAHDGYRPYILPKHELITPQYIFDSCYKRFDGRCWKWYSGSLDQVVVKNDRDPRGGAYVAWFRDRVEADKELKNLSANVLETKKIPGITLLEREVMEYDHFNRTGGHLDIENITLCSGSRVADGHVPRVHWGGGGMDVLWCGPDYSYGDLRSRQQFTF